MAPERRGDDHPVQHREAAWGYAQGVEFDDPDVGSEEAARSAGGPIADAAGAAAADERAVGAVVARATNASGVSSERIVERAEGRRSGEQQTVDTEQVVTSGAQDAGAEAADGTRAVQPGAASGIRGDGRAYQHE